MNSAQKPNIVDLLASVKSHWKLIVAAPVLGGVVAAGISLLIPPTFTSRTTLLPPQQSGNSASAVLASLGGLASLAGTPPKTQADQIVAILKSRTVADGVIAKLQLHEKYQKKFLADTRTVLWKSTQFKVDKKDGIVEIEASARDPEDAARIATEFVNQLKSATDRLAVTEAQQRRTFFAHRVEASLKSLGDAQKAVQDAEVTRGTFKLEPKLTAEAYTKQVAELAVAETKLQLMSQTFGNSSIELGIQRSLVAELRQRLAAAAGQRGGAQSTQYIDAVRNYKYMEALYESDLKQLELAKYDESREGPIIQVIDAAERPERRSAPKRGQITLATALISLILALVWSLIKTGAPAFNIRQPA